MTIPGTPAVLRDVVLHGQVAPGRAQATTRQGDAPVGGTVMPEQAAPSTSAEAIVDAARRQGYEDGRAEGHARGSEEAKRQAALAAEQADIDLRARAERLGEDLGRQAQAIYQARIETLDALIAALPRQIEARLAAAEDDMLALCFEAVCRILGEQAIRPEVLRQQLAHAVQALRDRPLVAVHLHPDDLATLQAEERSGAGRTEGDAIRWIGSTEVALGGCILQSPEGGLDARLEIQMQALRDLLQQERAAARASHEHANRL